MSVGRATSLFFDASCLFAAAASPNGGAAVLIFLCVEGLLTGWTSGFVLVETERNLMDKRPGPAWPELQRRIARGALQLAPALTSELLSVTGVNLKDVHVYGHAVFVAAEFIVTLDRALQAEINTVGGGPLAVSPGDFLRAHLPSHPEYAEIRRLLEP